MKTLEKYIEGGYTIEIKHNRGELELWINNRFSSKITNDYDPSVHTVGDKPVISTEERNLLSDVSIGTTIYNTTTLEDQTWNGTGWICYGKAHIGTGSLDTIIVSNDPNNPSYISGFFTTGASRGIELIDSATGTFENISGRVITSMVGTISLYPKETGGGAGVLHVFSERSAGGGDTWSINPFSLRTIEVPSNGESFATKTSSISQVLPGTKFRFRLLEDGPGGITITPSSVTAFGATIQSSSSTFILTEQETTDIV